MNKIIGLSILLGVVFSSFTQLRIGMIGPSEIFLLLAILLVIISKKGDIVIHKNIYNTFWVIFFFFISVSTLVFGFLDGNISIAYFIELSSYIFVFITVLMWFNFYIEQKTVMLERLMYYVYIVSSILLIIMYIFTFFSTNFFGIQLYFGERLRLLSENPHQLSTYIGPILIIGLQYFDNKILSMKNILLGINSILLFFIGLGTLSTTFYVAITLSFVFIFFLNIAWFLKSINKYLVVSLVFLIFSGILSFLYFRLDLIYRIFLSDENGVGRLLLWSEAIVLSAKNFFIGHGLGSVIPTTNSSEDTILAHNLILDVLLKGGIIPALTLLIMFIYSFYKFKSYKIYSTVLFFIVIYSIAGFTLNRVIFWFFIVTIFVLILKKRGHKNEKGINHR